MVSKKKLDFGFNGYRAPFIPKAPRSIRRRGPRKKVIEESELCAFELLAAVAGKLLEESESSACSNTDKAQPIDDKAFKSGSFDNGSCAESALVPEHNNLLSNDCDIKVGISDDKNSGGCKVEGSLSVGDSYNRKVESGGLENEKNDNIGYVSTANLSNVKDPIGECVNTNVLINSEGSVQLPLYRDCALSRKHLNNVKLGIRDDDENSYAKIRPFKPQSRLGQRRIRKVIASKYWKTGPKLKDYELYNTGEGMNSFYRYRKNYYARERCQRAHLKRRKLSEHRYDQEHNNDSSSAMLFHRGPSGASPTVKGHPKAKDPHVKLSIKSFKIPELYIEVPETATVASLKRTVIEAVTTILGGGIRVGVVLQGKKVRDDHRTLQQAGISQCGNLDNLGFTLEPSFTPKKLPVLSPCDVDQPLPRSPATPLLDSGISNASVDPPVVNVNNDELISPPKMDEDAIMDGEVTDSKALIPVSAMEVEALAVVPANPKPKRTELSNRRTRRPFSVAEVEGLVAAVENLGTGRWRDVKMLSFENADHRTYVDLKDKWKTLVHTASIAPQQRRGEPVPQELLNRVLSAHSYWSQHQSKQHGKHNNPVVVEPLKIEDETWGEGA